MRPADDKRTASLESILEGLIRTGTPKRAARECILCGARLNGAVALLLEEATEQEALVSFALVATDGSTAKQGAPLELELSGGQLLRIPRDVDPATLHTVLAVPRERA
jgi:hypothetical protein